MRVEQNAADVFALAPVLQRRSDVRSWGPTSVADDAAVVARTRRSMICVRCSCVAPAGTVVGCRAGLAWRRKASSFKQSCAFGHEIGMAWQISDRRPQPLPSRSGIRMPAACPVTCVRPSDVAQTDGDSGQSWQAGSDKLLGEGRGRPRLWQGSRATPWCAMILYAILAIAGAAELYIRDALQKSGTTISPA